MAGLSISHEAIDGDVDLLRASGSLDAHTFVGLESVIADLFTRGRYRLILDLAGVTYISSVGAGVLIAVASEADGNGGKVVVLNAREKAMVVFQLVGLTHVLTIENDLQKALAAVRGQ